VDGETEAFPGFLDEVLLDEDFLDEEFVINGAVIKMRSRHPRLSLLKEGKDSESTD
jgi:hypothetical protein